MNTEKAEPSLNIDETIEKSFLKMKSAMEKDGYREGIEEGKQKVFQTYFDQGYVDGFQNGLTLGKLKGALCAKSMLDKLNCPQIETLEKSSGAACIICKDEKLFSASMIEIKNNQSEIFRSVVNEIEAVSTK